MSNDTKGPEADAGASAMGNARPADPNARVGEPGTARAEAGTEPTGGSPRPDAAQLEAIVKALQDEIAAQNDTSLRLRAEMENLRKRFEREKADTAKYAITRFAQDVVNVGDNFQRAIAAVPPGAADEDVALKSFLDGILLAEREFINVLERHGVIRIDPKGEPFNPKIHNAVMEQENRDVPAGTVLQVFQSGYMIEDRCLKPALVVVSRGGAKGTRAAPSADPVGGPGGGQAAGGQGLGGQGTGGQSGDAQSPNGRTTGNQGAGPDAAAGGTSDGKGETPGTANG